jgi:hypothetical protein
MRWIARTSRNRLARPGLLSLVASPAAVSIRFATLAGTGDLISAGVVDSLLGSQILPGLHHHFFMMAQLRRHEGH